jgi:hypothetical protein
MLTLGTENPDIEIAAASSASSTEAVLEAAQAVARRLEAPCWDPSMGQNQQPDLGTPVRSAAPVPTWVGGEDQAVLLLDGRRDKAPP